MRNFYLVPAVMLWAVLLQPLFPQSSIVTENKLEDTLEYLETTPLEIEIHARITGEDRMNVWNTRTSEITTSGKSVSITLEGENLKVIAYLIPFVNEDGSMFLVARGEVWLGNAPGEEKKYYSTVKSLPIKAGESVIFFPTGMLLDTEDRSVYTIELEIQVEPVE